MHDGFRRQVPGKHAFFFFLGTVSINCDVGPAFANALDLAQGLTAFLARQVMDGVDGDDDVERVVGKRQFARIGDLYLRLHVLDRIGNRVFRHVDAFDGNARNELGHVVHHEPLGATDIKHRTTGRQAEVLLQGWDHWLPEAWQVTEASVTLASITVEKLLIEFACNPPVFFGFGLASVFNVTLAFGVVQQQVDFPANRIFFIHWHFLAQDFKLGQNGDR